MEALFGEKLQGKSGQVSTADAFAGKQAVGIYFSAHWCPPCRGFTPKLAEYYTKDLQGKGLEIVFVSSDKDQGAFDEYYGEQPWFALPFEDRDRKAALSKKFKVNGIPSFVIVDAEGKTITKDGKSSVSEDPTGADFPWKPKSIADIMGAAKLKKGSEDIDVKSAFASKKAIAFYFSAHWCPPCRGFTPQLAEWYKKDLQGKGLEVVFVSSDKDDGAFKEYYGEQPWLALDFAERKAKDELSKACNVEGIPSLVILDPSDFSIISLEGRGAISADPEGKEMPWHPKPVKDLAGGPGQINEVATLMAFCESSSDEEKRAIEDGLTPIAERYISEAKAKGEEDPEFSFMIVKSGGGLAERIRGMVSVEAATVMVLMDIPSDGAFYVGPEGAITPDAVEKFLADYKAGSLTRKQLS